MNRKRSSESRQVLVSFQSTESLAASNMPAAVQRNAIAVFCHVSRCGRRSRCRLDVRLRGKVRRIAVNIAKLPELLQKISGEHIAQ
jgi:hypothetical protein